uniref:Uncharacterized protein n=1 Tax=Physcomitrium patens TaxID=3218 RepID=A0A2K1J9G2_PHYPA|nr:hypothetical protein PHYPA_021276 [Physcomitrium patens]
MGSLIFFDALFNEFLPSNKDEEAWLVVDMYTCDQFLMFEFVAQNNANRVHAISTIAKPSIIFVEVTSPFAQIN